MNLNIFKSKDTAQERIKRKRELIARGDEIRLQLAGLDREKIHLEQELKAKNNALPGFTDERLRQFASEQKLKDEMIEGIAKAKERLAQITPQIAALTAELQHIKEVDIPACFQKTGIDEVMAFQEVLKSMRLDAGRLEDAIAAQRQIIARAEATVPNPLDRSARRAEILADIAIGQARQKDLDDLDRAIALDQKAHLDSRAKAEPIINQAAQTIAGLESKLSDQQRKIAWKERDTPLILEQFLASQISHAGAVYMSHALALKESFLKLIALDLLLKDATGFARNVLDYNLTIPLPKLEECKEFSCKEINDMIFSTKFAGPGNAIYQAMARDERERFAGEGCEIL